jgi:hypothetical protein
MFMMISINREKFNRLVIALRYIYGIIPIVIGVDKFFNYIVDWNIYVSPFVLTNLPLFLAMRFVIIVGLVEIVAGCIILNSKWTQFGAYLVAAWIGLIIINLFMIGGMYDIILRDVAIAVGYITLGMLVELKETSKTANF